MALAGEPPAEVAEELRDLFVQTNLPSYFERRGLLLDMERWELSKTGEVLRFLAFGLFLFDDFSQLLPPFLGITLEHDRDRVAWMTMRKQDKLFEILAEESDACCLMPATLRLRQFIGIRLMQLA